MLLRTPLLAAVAWSSLATHAGAAEVAVCRFTHSFLCGPTACAQVTPASLAVLDLDAREYRRCDAAGCERSTVTAVVAGTVVDVRFERGTATISADLTQLVEAVPVGTATLRSYGLCAKVSLPAPPTPPPPTRRGNLHLV